MAAHAESLMMKGFLVSFFSFLFFCVAPSFAQEASGALVSDGSYLTVTLPADNGGRIEDFRIKSAPSNLAGSMGLLNEGFGIASPYIPSRRINERLEKRDAGDPEKSAVWVYSYDCDGPHIKGLHVARSIEPVPDESSVRIRWRIENKGQESHWISPWVRNDVAPGGVFSSNDRMDVPTISGIQRVTRSGYYPATRNWIAASSPTELTTVYGVFNADQLHSFLGVFEEQKHQSEFQACFVPRVLNPGEAWETAYCINVVRGLKHVDFASEEIAAQLDYSAGKLVLLLSSVKPMNDVRIYANVVGSNGRRWKLSPKRFDIAPERVVRCTFDWIAPADGSYEFLAQLKGRDGQPIELNPRSAAPHGGIDTRFTVGPVPTGSMAAWTDAPYALDRGQRVLSRRLVTQTPADIWVEGSLEKIFPNDVVKPGGPAESTVKVSLARNERESFQIVMRPPKERALDDVQFHIGDLSGPNGAVLEASNISASLVKYYPVQIPSFYEGPTGEHPDALVSFKPFSAPGGRTTPVWFTLHAPAGTPAGVYRGKIMMLASGADPVHINVEAQIFGFDLPVTPRLKTDFVYYPEHAAQWARKVGCTLSSSKLAALYSQNALEHRVTLRCLSELPGPGSPYWADPAKLDGYVKERLARGATTFSVPDGLLQDANALQQINRAVDGALLKGRAFCQVAGEPPPDAWPNVVELCRQWKTAAPQIPLMATTFGYQAFLDDNVDIWAVNSQVLDTGNNERILERMSSGHETWWYVNRFNARPYANFLVDFAALEHRILFWQTWALGISCVHYWGVNYAVPEQNPYEDQLDLTPVNGDGFLVYPGPEGPQNSIRWECIRDGIEDYDYLCLCMDLLKQATAAGVAEPALQRAVDALNVKAIVPDLTGYTRDASLLQEARMKLAQSIEELSKLVRTQTPPPALNRPPILPNH